MWLRHILKVTLRDIASSGLLLTASRLLAGKMVKNVLSPSGTEKNPDTQTQR
jgi:hypothetical protein